MNKNKIKEGGGGGEEEEEENRLAMLEARVSEVTFRAII